MLDPLTEAAPGRSQPQRMVVRRLSLVTFRSYTALEAEFSGGPQVVVGPNAAGKTNLWRAWLSGDWPLASCLARR
jgi:hypothetical protein